MEFCSIVPLGYNTLVTNRPYTMLLAHLALNNPDYVYLYSHSSSYKIMDNSIIELGDAFSIQELVLCAVSCKVNEIILPDVFMDPKATLRKVRSSIAWLKSHGYFGKFKLMAVCHGNNLEEFSRYFKIFSKMKDIDVIGIPKVITKWIGNRGNLEKLVKTTDKPIHLLGCWDSLKELDGMSSFFHQRVRTMDTCLPALLSNFTTDFRESRKGSTINLEKHSLNTLNYCLIMASLDEYLHRTASEQLQK